MRRSGNPGIRRSGDEEGMRELVAQRWCEVSWSWLAGRQVNRKHAS
jgi:hypothetical protein